MRRDRPRPDPVKIEYTNADGKKYGGWYTIERNGTGLTVTSAWGNKYALLHRSRPEVLAPIMLRGLVEEAKRRGESVSHGAPLLATLHAMPKGRKIEPKLSERAMKLITVLRAIDTSRLPSAPDEAFAGFSRWGHAVFDVLAESIEALRNGEITERENAAIGKESQRITRAMHEHLRTMKQKRTH